jgi:hypothetical protein
VARDLLVRTDVTERTAAQDVLPGLDHDPHHPGLRRRRGDDDRGDDQESGEPSLHAATMQKAAP